MKKEFVIVGVILVAVGIGLATAGFIRLQPTRAEKAVGFMKGLTESMTGEKLPELPTKNVTGAKSMVALCCIAFVAGLFTILKSGKKESQEAGAGQERFCSSCGKRIEAGVSFCPNCGHKTG